MFYSSLSESKAIAAGGKRFKPDLTRVKIIRFTFQVFVIFHLESEFSQSPDCVTPSVQASPDFFGMRGRTLRGSVIWLEAGDGRVQFREEMENGPWMLMRRCPTICSHAPPDQSASNYTMTGRGTVRPPAPTCPHHTLIGCDR